MKLERLKILVLVFFVLFINFDAHTQDNFEKDFNCFSIIVGKNASVDGSVLLAHNEDDYGLRLVNLYKVPRANPEASELVYLKNGAKAPQVRRVNSYLWFEVPKENFGDAYVNEWGVVIASDACRSREQNPELTDGGIGYWLRRLMAERSRTAKEAVKIGGELVEKFGYASSGRTYVIADAKEGWMLSVVKGKHWVAKRVPDNHVAVIPNYYTIGEVDLADTTHYLGCADLIEYAIKNKWHDPTTNKKFNFAMSYGNPGSQEHPGNISRMWRGVNLIAGKNYKTDEKFPFSLIPEDKISVRELTRVLRDHYVGTEFDKTDNYKLGNPYELSRSTICAGSNQVGFVAQLRGWMPVEIGTVIWTAFRRPDSQAFFPIYLGIEEVPADFYYGDYATALDLHFSPPEQYYEKNEDHAFWTYWKLADWIDKDYGNRIIKVRQKWTELEKQMFDNQAEFEKNLVNLYKENPAKAKKLMTEYTSDWAKKTRELARKLIDK